MFEFGMKILLESGKHSVVEAGVAKPGQGCLARGAALRRLSRRGSWVRIPPPAPFYKGRTNPRKRTCG